MKHRLLAYAGLARPYRFERTLAVLAAFSLAVVIAAAAIHFYVAGKLPLHSPRYWYFVYMAAAAITTASEKATKTASVRSKRYGRASPA